MSVNTHLTNLASNLVLSADEKSSIATSIQTLQSRLGVYFGNAITKHFQFGSSTRDTILPRKADENSDIDYMVVFDTTTETQKKPQTYLNRLKQFVETKYSRSEIYQSSPTIVLSLNHIKFELVPAIYNYGYYIPSPASNWLEWIATDPLGINQALLDANKKYDYNIKPLVRLVKYWNVSQGRLFTSFSLEKYIVNQFIWECSALRDYFYSFWSGFSPNTISQSTRNKVESAKQHAKNAQQYEADDMPISAEQEINKIVPAL